MGSRYLRLDSQRLELAEALRTTRQHSTDIGTLYRERDGLGKNREQLLGALRERAAGLELAQLKGRVSAKHFVVLQDLKKADDVHLAPLRQALTSFRAARKTRTPRPTLLRLARNLASLYRATPRSLLRRLAPPQLKLILTATTIVAAVVRKVAGETPDRDQARQSMRP